MAVQSHRVCYAQLPCKVVACIPSGAMDACAWAPPVAGDAMCQAPFIRYALTAAAEVWWPSKHLIQCLNAVMMDATSAGETTATTHLMQPVVTICRLTQHRTHFSLQTLLFGVISSCSGLDQFNQPTAGLYSVSAISHTFRLILLMPNSSSCTHTYRKYCVSGSWWWQVRRWQMQGGRQLVVAPRRSQLGLLSESA